MLSLKELFRRFDQKKIGILSVVVFVLSQFLYLTDIQPELLKLALIYGTQFPLYLIIFLLFKNSKLSFRWIFFATVLSRVIAWNSIPLLEDDYHRYLWDGRVFSHGINPYQYPPDHEALDALDTPYREHINYLYIGTIYPPLAQYLFWLNHQFFPDSLNGLKLWYLLFDFGTLIVIWNWIRFRKARESLILLYAFSPLVIKEIANSAHLDAMALFFLSLAFFWAEKALVTGKWTRAWMAITLSLATKLFAFLLLPIFFLKDGNRFKNLFLSMTLLGLLYVPFLGAGANLFGGLSAFGKYWTFNESFFFFFDWTLNKIIKSTEYYRESVFLKTAILNSYPARLASAGLLGLFVLFRLKYMMKSSNLAREALILLSALFVLSPVVNSWYLLWILPFVVMEKNTPWLLFTFLCGGAYSFFHDKNFLAPWQVIEYTLFYGFTLIWWYQKRRDRSKHLSS